MGTTPARIGSAAAVLRRVVEGSVRHGADRALTEGRSWCSGLGHYLGPEEPGELAGDSGGNKPSARSCGRPIVGTAWTSGLAQPTSGPASQVARLVDAR